MIHTQEETERFILVGVYGGSRSRAEAGLDELAELVRTVGAEVVGRVLQRLDAPEGATYVGSGKTAALREMVHHAGATGIVTDDELTAVQMRNLGDATGCKVIDRTILILDIFARRAQTREGKLQVELAQLNNRLTHLIGQRNLSRLGGGIGTRGPGEKKLETDRRHIRNRINNIRHELKEVKKHRTVTRRQRTKNRIFTFSVVGYTNAGKSTLFNRLTDAGVLQEDKLFATLDSTVRTFTLPDNRQVLLTDTVGFVNKLPHHLVEAFRGTLEEAAMADALIHVVDASDGDCYGKMALVYGILDDLGAGRLPVLTVFNKMDQLTGRHEFRDARATRSVRMSLLYDPDTRVLAEAMQAMANAGLHYVEWVVDYGRTAFIADIRTRGHLLEETYEPDGIHVKAYVTDELFRRQHKERSGQ
ncbi:MAG: GTPase HflX [Eubacteriales bacterium]|nr:GTPase HflX [Eubacteriales bacterium]